MKTFIFSILVCAPFLVFGQVVDTAAVKHQVDSLINNAVTLSEQGDFDKALEVNAVAEKLALEKLGRETSAYGKCCHNHGRILFYKADYPESEKWYLDAIDINGKVLGKEHKGYIASLSALVALYGISKNYSKGVQLCLEIKNIQERISGKDDSDYAVTLNNLANMYKDKGDSPKAIPLYLKAIEIWGKTLGKEHPYYTIGLDNLAGTYNFTGEYDKAEILFLEANEIWSKSSRKESQGYAIFLVNLAIFYVAKGDFDKAEQLVLEALEIGARSFGKTHPNYAFFLDELGSIYTNKSDYTKAIKTFSESKEILANALGKENTDYAESLTYLAYLYSNTGEYAKALPLFLEANEIWIKTKSVESPRYALLLNYLAMLYSDMGEYGKSEPLFLESKELMERMTGKETVEYVYLLSNFAEYYQETKQIQNSAIILIEMNELVRRLLEQSATYSSENQMLAFMHLFESKIAEFRSFSQSYPNSELMRKNFDDALFFNGLLLENSRHLALSVAEADSLTVDTYERWQGCQRRLANEYTKPLAERQFIAEVKEEAEGYEKTLIRNLPAFSEARKVPHWQEVQNHLPHGSVAVEFIHYQYCSPKPTDSTMYAALLLRPGDSEPQFIPLYEEKSLDSLLQTQGERKADYVNNLYTVAERGAKPLGTPQKSLYELLWQPLEKELAGTQTIYFSPSGLLHRLNIGAIPISDEETLADRYRLVELGSTRQLVIPFEVKVANQDALLFGGIKYEMDSTAISQANVDLTSETVASTRGELSFIYADSTLRGGTWDYLKYTDKEVTALEPIMKSGGIQATTRRGYAATEVSFKTIGKDKPSPRILHIATHGFFFPDPAEKVGSRQLAVGNSEPVFKLSDHPMIRSGLILAGGNHAWQTGKPLKPDMEDGVLTAYEISQMNLSNTELVVLSACETGLGDIEGNEGVYGLQRAFKIAGAKYLIMSLWQVPDYQTQELMTTFYKRWLEGKMSIPDAFRSAQKEMREKYQVPYFWAGFVLVE